MSGHTITPDESVAMIALGENFRIIGRVFQDGEGSPATMRMASAGLREAANVLDGICDRWETA